MVSYKLEAGGQGVDKLLVEGSDVGEAVVVDGLHLAVLAIRLTLLKEGLAVGRVELLGSRTKEREVRTCVGVARL